LDILGNRYHKPLIFFIEVRNSWLMSARKALFMDGTHGPRVRQVNAGDRGTAAASDRGPHTHRDPA